MSKVVGHKTYLNDDGTRRHEPLHEDEAAALWEQAEANRKRRKDLIPDEQTALRLMMDCYQRLLDMGWSKPPKFTIQPGVYGFKVIEFGSTGTFDVTCNVGSDGKFEWWHASDGDLWPITPLMVKDVVQPKPQATE